MNVSFCSFSSTLCYCRSKNARQKKKWKEMFNAVGGLEYCIWICLKENEPLHDKTNEMTCAPSEDAPSLIKVFTVHMKKGWVLSYPLSAKGRLIKLGGCPGWSESSLGAQVILLVLSCCGSNTLSSAAAVQTVIWAMSWQNLSSEVCDQIRLDSNLPSQLQKPARVLKFCL